MKRIDFPVKPHILKYLQVHLQLAAVSSAEGQLEDYVLSKTDQFGFALYHLLRRPVKSARHESSTKDCVAVLGVNLRNFNYPHYDLSQGKLPAYTIFQFNDFVDEILHKDLYRHVREQHQRRSTIKESIRTFMAMYHMSEDDIAYETLRKSVSRNVKLRVKKNPRKTQKNFSMNPSQKTGGLSQKNGEMSQKVGVMSHKESFRVLRQHLTALPLPIYDIEFLHAARR